MSGSESERKGWGIYHIIRTHIHAHTPTCAPSPIHNGPQLAILHILR